MLLEAREATVHLGGRMILDKVGFGVAKGEMVGLIGPNGAGKTTLLRVLAGLQAPDSGEVSLDGSPLRHADRRRLARRLAYVAQGAHCHWPLAVERLVELGRLPHLVPRQRLSTTDSAAIARAMAAADVTQFAARTVTSLSAGERARAMIARALASEPRILLADEPIAALDPEHQLRILELLRAMARAGGAVVVVMHDLTLAARFCDRLALLHDGKVMVSGPPADILTTKTLAQAYGIRAVFGKRDGEIYVVPWEPTRGLLPRR